VPDKQYGSATNVMLFFRSKGVATPLLRKNRKKKTLNLQYYQQYIRLNTNRVLFCSITYILQKN
jgi:hypothetical protein